MNKVFSKKNLLMLTLLSLSAFVSNNIFSAEVKENVEAKNASDQLETALKAFQNPLAGADARQKLEAILSNAKEIAKKPAPAADTYAEALRFIVGYVEKVLGATPPTPAKPTAQAAQALKDAIEANATFKERLKGFGKTVNDLLANPNTEMNPTSKNNALIVATNVNSPEIVKALLDAGADANQQQADNEATKAGGTANFTALDVAIANKNKPIEEILRKVTTRKPIAKA